MNIVILGGGTAGWMAANLFAKKWHGKPVNIKLVESPDVGIVGVGEGSTPTLKRFFEMMDIQEADWMIRCNATYKLNIRFNDWSPNSIHQSYSHPFPTQVDTFNTRAFMVNTRTRRMGLETHVKPEDFLLNGILSKHNLGPKTPATFPFKIEYGYHFDSQLLGEFLAENAIQLGVENKKVHVKDAIRSSNGNISDLITQCGDKISGDFFVDCTGFSSFLMQKTLGVGFTHYKDNLFNDSALVMPSTISSEIPVETESTALSAGWCWKIPLTNRFGNGYVYSSDFISDDAAEIEFRQHLGLMGSHESCRHLKMKVGVLKEHWSKNCIALGLSQGFIEPLEATALHLVQISIELFIQKFEEGNFSSRLANDYNKSVSERFECVRDYIVAHYKLNTRNDSEYWRANRDNNHLSDSLVGLLDTWFKREDLALEIEKQKISTHFDAVSWHCLFAGYGAFPPLHPNQPGKGDLYKEKGVSSFLEGCRLNFTGHQHNLSLL